MFRPLIFTLLFVTLSAQADPKSFYYERYLEGKDNKQFVQTVATHWFNQAVDHQNISQGTFKQRYYINNQYAKSDDAPVFFYICGESACEASRVTRGAIVEQAAQFGARVVALEHRFYGQSMPTKSLSTAELSYLSTEAALQDAATFQKSLRENFGWTGKWVAYGGSYPGSLSAYYRLKYPELIVASLASSAPVQAKANFVEYDEHVAEQAGSVCLANIQHAVAEVERQLDDDVALKAIKAQFHAGDIQDTSDFMYVIADVAAAAVQYGMREEFCNHLSHAESPLKGYARFAKTLFDRWGISALDMTAAGAMSEDPNDYATGIGMRAWLYQSCTEYGYWQNASEDPMHRARSVLINNAYHNQLCQRVFGLNNPVDTTAINQQYYLPLQTHASGIFFSNGSEDPWSRLSLTAENGNNQNPLLAYHTIQGAAHCDDLHASSKSDSVALREARESWISFLKNNL